MEEALSLGFVEGEVYTIGDKEMAPCRSCFRCTTLKECSIEDDFQGLRDKWVAADAIIYSVPVYHMGIPAQLKCFIDRLGNSLWAAWGGPLPQSLKVVGSIAQGCHIFSGQEQALIQLINHAIIMGCIPVRGDLWESYIGGAGWTANSVRKDALRKLYQKGDLLAQAAVNSARSLGRRVAQVALLAKSGGEVQREMLEADGGYGLFLERL
jgi:multimeric flavodoxin WrbA